MATQFLHLSVPEAQTLTPGEMADLINLEIKRRHLVRKEGYSLAIASIDPKYGLDPLPSYRDPLEDQNDPETKEQYAIHSRTHETPWLRSLRPDPTCEVHATDANRLGLHNGDTVEMSSPYGKIRMKVKITTKSQPGVLMALHGYTEANVNELIGRNHLDPYSGYPGFKGIRCNIRKIQEG